MYIKVTSIALLAFLSGYGTHYLQAQRTNGTKVSVSHELHDISKPNILNEAELPSLVKDSAQTGHKKPNTTLTNTSKEQNHHIASFSNSTQKRSEMKMDVRAKNEALELAKSVVYSQEIRTKQPDEIHERVDAYLGNSIDLDYDLTERTRQEYTDNFERNKIFTNWSVNSYDCKNLTCRLNVYSESDADIYTALLNPDSSLGHDTQFFLVPNIETGAYDLYLSKEEAGFFGG